ncbi:MAG: hypothetical protein QOJ03_2056 [Frankiaceae bacterium]|jgi:hypothetical protein|nr:hypothetical protein [Frankiaceae bacterium]
MSGRHRKPPAKRGQGRHRTPPGHGHWVAPALVAVMVLGAGGVGAHAAFTGHPGGDPPGSVALTAPTTAPASPPGAVTPAPPTATPPAGHPSGRPAPLLAITVTGGVSWIQVAAPHGRLLFSGLLRHGRRLVYRHGTLHVVIGNAGAVRLDRHGRQTAPAGRAGQVLRFVAT